MKEELLYSCNPEINAWMVANKDVYTNISRAELATFSYEKRSAIFGNFSPERKVEIYMEKYHYLMGLNTLSKEEKEYLTELFQWLTPSFYCPKTDNTEFDEFSEKWTYVVMDKFGWKYIDVVRYTHTWLTNEEFESTQFEERNLSSRKSAELETGLVPKSCTCRNDSHCNNGITYPWRKCKTTTECISSGTQCGALGLQCTGLCGA